MDQFEFTEDLKHSQAVSDLIDDIVVAHHDKVGLRESSVDSDLEREKLGLPPKSLKPNRRPKKKSYHFPKKEAYYCDLTKIDKWRNTLKKGFERRIDI